MELNALFKLSFIEIMKGNARLCFCIVDIVCPPNKVDTLMIGFFGILPPDKVFTFVTEIFAYRPREKISNF